MTFKYMQKDFSYGIIPIYKEQDGKFSVLILKHPDSHDGPSAGFWGFPKGHKEEGESDIQAARRELAEEAGIDRCEIIDKIKFTDHYFMEFKGNQFDKTVTYFPAFAAEKSGNIDSIHNQEHGESIDLKWVDLSELTNYLTFKNQDKLISDILDWLNHYES